MRCFPFRGSWPPPRSTRDALDRFGGRATATHEHVADFPLDRGAGDSRPRRSSLLLAVRTSTTRRRSYSWSREPPARGPPYLSRASLGTPASMYPILFELPEWLPLIGGAAITSFGVFMLLSFLTAGYVLRAELRRQGQDPEKAWDLVFMAVIGGIVGARLYYLILNFPQFLENPMGMLLSRGGLVWYGGFLLATALVVWEVRRQKMPLAMSADACAPALALAYAVGRVGCFLVGD